MKDFVIQSSNFHWYWSHIHGYLWERRWRFRV